MDNFTEIFGNYVFPVSMCIYLTYLNYHIQKNHRINMEEIEKQQKDEIDSILKSNYDNMKMIREIMETQNNNILELLKNK